MDKALPSSTDDEQRTSFEQSDIADFCSARDDPLRATFGGGRGGATVGCCSSRGAVAELPARAGAELLPFAGAVLVPFAGATFTHFTRAELLSILGGHASSHRRRRWRRSKYEGARLRWCKGRSSRCLEQGTLCLASEHRWMVEGRRMRMARVHLVQHTSDETWRSQRLVELRLAPATCLARLVSVVVVAVGAHSAVAVDESTPAAAGRVRVPVADELLSTQAVVDEP